MRTDVHTQSCCITCEEDTHAQMEAVVLKEGRFCILHIKMQKFLLWESNTLQEAFGKIANQPPEHNTMFVLLQEIYCILAL